MSKPSIINDSVEMVDVELLRTHPQNCRQGDIGAVCESILANGFWGHLIVQTGSCHILAGNHRYLAARSLGMKELPVVWVDVDDERALRILLADNRTSDLASMDERKLAELLAGLENTTDAKLSGTGYDADDLDDLIKDLAKSATPQDEEPKKKGEDRLAIVLLCESESEQEDLHDELRTQGLFPRKTVLNERTQLALGK